MRQEKEDAPSNNVPKNRETQQPRVGNNNDDGDDDGHIRHKTHTQSLTLSHRHEKKEEQM